MCAWRRVWVNQRNSFYSVFASICFFLSLHTWHDLNIFFFSSLSIPLQCRWSKIRWTYRHRHSRKFYHYAHRPVLLVVHIQCCRECFFPFILLKNKKKELRKIKWRRKSGCSVFQTFFSHWNAIFSFYFVLVVASAPFDICWLLEQNSISVLQLVLCLLAHTRSLGDFSITHLLIQEFASVCVWVLDAVFRLIYTIMGQHKCIISLEFIPFCPIPFGTVPFRSVLFHSFRIL